MKQKRDYYEVLGVKREASDQEIKSAYRRLAMQHHPDRNPDNKEESEEKFKEITEAYSVLADPQKRAAYDRFGHAAVGGGGGGAPDFNSTIFSDFEDIFGDLFGFGDVFGRARPRTQPQRGRNRSALRPGNQPGRSGQGPGNQNQNSALGGLSVLARERAPSREANP